MVCNGILGGGQAKRYDPPGSSTDLTNYGIQEYIWYMFPDQRHIVKMWYFDCMCYCVMLGGLGA